jgi:hypothetical protein
VTGVPEIVIFRSVTVYNKNLSSQCNLLAQIEEAEVEEEDTKLTYFPPF